MSLSKKAIRIINAPPGCNTHTSIKRAIEYISRGRARRVSDQAIEFLARDHRNVSAEKSARKRFSSGAGFASLEAIANLPVIRPVMLLTRKRPLRPPVELPDDYVIDRHSRGYLEF